MPDQQEIEVQQGIWIKAQWIRDAGLGTHLRVMVQPGEIRVLAMPPQVEEQEPSQEGWNVFRSLGCDAQPGRLSNAAIEHDRYLYGKSR